MTALYSFGMKNVLNLYIYYTVHYIIQVINRGWNCKTACIYTYKIALQRHVNLVTVCILYIYFNKLIFIFYCSLEAVCVTYLLKL